MIVVAIIGVLAALAIYGVRRYVASAKTSEAKNAVGAISRGAAAAFERRRAEPGVEEAAASGAPASSGGAAGAGRSQAPGSPVDASRISLAIAPGPRLRR
jgi:type IV pilus assembly protein PilA